MIRCLLTNVLALPRLNSRHALVSSAHAALALSRKEADSSLRHEDIRSLCGRIIERDIAECGFNFGEKVHNEHISCLKAA